VESKPEEDFSFHQTREEKVKKIKFKKKKKKTIESN